MHFQTLGAQVGAGRLEEAGVVFLVRSEGGLDQCGDCTAREVGGFWMHLEVGFTGFPGGWDAE